ncbi:UPF0058 family protein [Haloplanus litoreus]|uniref:UPF0058 family protein n=1 Tax=Haloplanus litoreus TaxID=767515 RepID=A0ABD5ZX39_9EURY
MRKKEYIHIHALLVEVTRHLMENEEMPAETLSTYDALGTPPSGIHKSKQKHAEAITALNDAIGPWLEHTCADRPVRSRNGP